MALSQKGVSRQEAHEQIRVLSHQSTKLVKEEGKDNDLMDRIRRTRFFEPIADQVEKLLDPRSYVGRSSQQVARFTGPGGEVERALERYEAELPNRATVNLNV